MNKKDTNKILIKNYMNKNNTNIILNNKTERNNKNTTSL